jgi:N-hydroxyarylamine O-acetyltransferase
LTLGATAGLSRRTITLASGTTVELSAYLDRIAFTGAIRPDRATLAAISKAHLLAIPYENLDVQLGRPLTIAPATAYDRIVRRGRRGGWCYEMNGLFGWALGEIGFEVSRLASGVARSMKGDVAIGNHLVLRVDMDEGPILADVGLANGPLGPYPIAEGAFSIEGFDYRLERLEDGYWRFHNHPQGMAPNFDFKDDDADEDALARTCVALQTDPQSPFLQNLVCVRFADGGRRQNHLRGRVLKHVTPEETRERVLETADDLLATLEQDFGITEPQAAGLWPKICERHDALFAKADPVVAGEG